MQEKFTKSLPVKLTEPEIKNLGAEQSRLVRDVISLEAEKKDVAQELKGKIDNHTGRIRDIAEMINTGVQYRQVECRQHKRGSQMITVRADTGEEIDRRPLTKEEQQMTLADMVDSNTDE